MSTSSPFPGMDPYLESPAFWSDFHASFITYWRDALSECLPDRYEARIDEKVNLVEIAPPRGKRIEPDVAITHHGSARSASPAPAQLATLVPIAMSLVIEEETHERHIEILHRPDRTLVAVLELLSPTNKVEPGRSLYLAKRNALAHHPIHLTELDFLLKGRRLPLDQDLPAGDYFALISNGRHRPRCDVYAWSMRQALPAIPIPLLSPDPDIWVDLGAVFRTTYERGRYARAIDYASPPPLSVDDETGEWIQGRTTAWLKQGRDFPANKNGQ